MLLGDAHPLVRVQLPRDLRVGIERLADMGFERGRGPAMRKVRGTPVELDERALDFLLVRVLRQASQGQ